MSDIKIKIRRGDTVPSTDQLDLYELGYQRGTNNLYIHDDSGIKKIGGSDLEAGNNITITNGKINVETTDQALPPEQQDNTKPITSAGVYTILGNIDVILQGI